MKKGLTLVELLVGASIVLIIGLALFSAIKGGDSCSFYKYSPMREVPANCYSYFMESK